jgi:hypothetical protein
MYRALFLPQLRPSPNKYHQSKIPVKMLYRALFLTQLRLFSKQEPSIENTGNLVHPVGEA